MNTTKTGILVAFELSAFAEILGHGGNVDQACMAVISTALLVGAIVFRCSLTTQGLVGNWICSSLLAVGLPPLLYMYGGILVRWSFPALSLGWIILLFMGYAMMHSHWDALEREKTNEEAEQTQQQLSLA